jgi:hypothetical protein
MFLDEFQNFLGNADVFSNITIIGAGAAMISKRQNVGCHDSDRVSAEPGSPINGRRPPVGPLTGRN